MVTFEPEFWVSGIDTTSVPIHSTIPNPFRLPSQNESSCRVPRFLFDQEENEYGESKEEKQEAMANRQRFIGLRELPSPAPEPNALSKSTQPSLSSNGLHMLLNVKNKIGGNHSLKIPELPMSPPLSPSLSAGNPVEASPIEELHDPMSTLEIGKPIKSKEIDLNYTKEYRNANIISDINKTSSSTTFNKSSKESSGLQYSASTSSKRNVFRDILSPKPRPPLMRNEGMGERSYSASAVLNADSALNKYGKCTKSIVGRGATACVKLMDKTPSERNSGTGNDRIYCIKEFRKRRRDESEKDYLRRLTSEFCISSSLHHTNVVETVDLVLDENHHWCEVMEYCPGGDLYSAIRNSQLCPQEIDCCFKQLIYGVAYLHSMGVAHRDLKPENLLFDKEGHLKIADFGVSEVFRTAFEREPHMSRGICGSAPYIAPEEFESKEYDAREVDVWSCGIIYYAMTESTVPWRHASPSDPRYREYLASRKEPGGFPPFQRLPEPCRSVMYRILDPNPKTRITIAELLVNPWFKSIEVCTECKGSADSNTNEKETTLSTLSSSSSSLSGKRKHHGHCHGHYMNSSKREGLNAVARGFLQFL